MEGLDSSNLRVALNCPKLQKFWERCSIDERRLISSVEKVAVVKKIKERFKHRCECQNCRKGRIYFEDRVRFVDEIVTRLETGGKQISSTGDASKWILYEPTSNHSKSIQVSTANRISNCEKTAVCSVPDPPKCTDATDGEEDDCASNVFVFDDMLYIYQGRVYLRDSLLKKENALGMIGNRLDRCHLEWINSKTSKPCEFCETIRIFETTVCILLEEKSHKMLHQKEAEEKVSKVLEQLLKEATKNKSRKKKKKVKYVPKIPQKSAVSNDEAMMEDDSTTSESGEVLLSSQDLQKEATLEPPISPSEEDSWDGIATKKGIKLFKKPDLPNVPFQHTTLQVEDNRRTKSCHHTPCTPQWNEFSYFCMHQEMKDEKIQTSFMHYGNCFALPTLFDVPPFLYQ